MKLASYRSGCPDGRLLVVARDQRSAIAADAIAPTMLAAMAHWDEVAPRLQALYQALNDGAVPEAFSFDPRLCAAPLPRSFQWCDGSAFLNHGRLMQQAFGTEPMADVETVPLMYQGAGDDLLGPHVEVRLPSEELGIDFEGEFGVIVGPVPMGATAVQAHSQIRLLVQINDWSLRALGPREMKSGFGFLHAKPSSSFAPLALTPDELGDDWRDSRIWLDLEVKWKGKPFGRPNGGEMHFGFDELIVHAARTRKLGPGTIIGSGTVSNADLRAGPACIAEKRVVEIIEHGAARTTYMQFGDTVSMAAVRGDDERPFGTIEQRVLRQY